MTQTVMVVEDERLVRTLAARILRDAGLEVVEAPDGREAWRQLQSLAPTIHLLLSDVVMPHMNGIELAGRVSQAWPNLPVLLMTAFTPTQLVDHGLNEGHLATLTKPFDADALLEQVRACIRPPA